MCILPTSYWHTLMLLLLYYVSLFALIVNEVGAQHGEFDFYRRYINCVSTAVKGDWQLTWPFIPECWCLYWFELWLLILLYQALTPHPGSMSSALEDGVSSERSRCALTARRRWIWRGCSVTRILFIVGFSHDRFTCCSFTLDISIISWFNVRDRIYKYTHCSCSIECRKTHLRTCHWGQTYRKYFQKYKTW